MAAPKRFFVENIAEEVELPISESRHARNVLRLAEGDEVTLFDGSGSEYSAVVTRADKNGVSVHVVRAQTSDREPKTDAFLLVGALKGDKTELVQDIFDFWFVQYDFPNAQGKPYKSSGGKLVWCNELNHAIPCDWKYGNLYEIADFINGLACQKHRPKCCELSLPVIKIKEMHDGITEHTERATANVPDDYIVHSGDILFSWSATLEVPLHK